MSIGDKNFFPVIYNYYSLYFGKCPKYLILQTNFSSFTDTAIVTALREAHL